MQCENNPSQFRQRKLFERKFVCFLVCFVVVFLFFFWGGGRGLGLGLGFVLFWRGAGIQRNATLTQSIALRSAIVGRENLIAGGLFVLFVFLVFILFLLFFQGRGLVELFWGVVDRV